MLQKKPQNVRGSNKPHINKTLRKAIVKRSQLKNKTNETKGPKGILKYKRHKTQRSHLVKPNSESKKEHFD